MESIQFHILQAADSALCLTIADWYATEWQIPKEKTLEKLNLVINDANQFQVVMSLNTIPIATGGVYKHVGLLDREPQFKKHPHWLALIYTQDAYRKQGYGALLCEYIQHHAKSPGMTELYLYTDTAESLYQRLDWIVKERIHTSGRFLVIMSKVL